MSCTVLGPGLVGCYLGAAAGAAAVHYGPSQRLRARHVRLPNGSLRRWSPRAANRADAGPLLVACRAPDTPATLPGTALLAQNGLGQTQPAIACFFALDLIGDELHATGPRPRLVLDPPPACWQPVLQAWDAAGIDVHIGDAAAARFEKAVLNASVGPLCLATGASMTAVWSDPALRDCCLRATREGEAIAAAAGIALAPGLCARAEAFFADTGPHRPSVLDDPRELDWVLPPLLRMADRHGIDCPALQAIAQQSSARLAGSR